MSIIDKLKMIFQKKITKENNCNIDLNDLKEKYIKLLRNCIGVEIKESIDENNLMRFGGKPHRKISNGLTLKQILLMTQLLQ